MPHANVKLSKTELKLVTNKEFILTKKIITEKVYHLFGTLSIEYKERLQDFRNIFPAEVLLNSPKIYRGENYKDLPYIMLDYPKYFSKEDAMAIRNFFWWGNFFSITLHLSGKYKQHYAGVITKWLCENKDDNWFICINSNPWENSFEEANYAPAKDFNDIEKARDLISQKSFIKIAKKIPLEKWDEASEFYKKSFTEILLLLNGQLPKR